MNKNLKYVGYAQPRSQAAKWLGFFADGAWYVFVGKIVPSRKMEFKRGLGFSSKEEAMAWASELPLEWNPYSHKPEQETCQ